MEVLSARSCDEGRREFQGIIVRDNQILEDHMPQKDT